MGSTGCTVTQSSRCVSVYLLAFAYPVSDIMLLIDVRNRKRSIISGSISLRNNEDHSREPASGAGRPLYRSRELSGQPANPGSPGKMACLDGVYVYAIDRKVIQPINSISSSLESFFVVQPSVDLTLLGSHLRGK